MKDTGDIYSAWRQIKNHKDEVLRKTVIIILRHLFCKLQILLFSLSSLLSTHTNLFHLPSVTHTHTRLTSTRLLPQQTPGLCCKLSVEISSPVVYKHTQTHTHISTYWATWAVRMTLSNLLGFFLPWQTCCVYPDRRRCVGEKRAEAHGCCRCPWSLWTERNPSRG